MRHILPITLLLLGFALLLGRLLATHWKGKRARLERERCEDVLKYILKREANGRIPTLEGISGALGVRPHLASDLLNILARQGMITLEGGRISLLPAGRELALHIVRAHRLWESYLADQTGLGEESWHDVAEKAEHRLTPEDAAALAARLGHPVQDPHGDEIPGEEGMARDPGINLNAAEPGQRLRIVHLEDEPASAYAQLVALGLRPGMGVRLIERTPDRLLLWAAGHEHTLAPMLAQNVSVIPALEGDEDDLDEGYRLEALASGQHAHVLGLVPACRGPQRRRLLDFGFVPGTEVAVEMTSPLGDPTAYRVRGAIVALRRDQAHLIRISSPLESA